MKTYYKVVLPVDERSWGSAVITRADLWCCYRIGEVTRPPVGALMGFESQEAAEKWVACWSNTHRIGAVILAGKGRKSRFKCPSRWLWGSIEDLRRQWSGKPTYWPQEKFHLPTGTVLLSQFTPEREVREWIT